MTCIAAVVAEDGSIYLGGDSAGVDESDYTLGVGAEAKVWLAGGMVWGGSGSFRVSQLVRWQMHIPQPMAETDPLEYITGPLVDAIRDVLASGGALTTWDDDSTEELTSSNLLIGYAGRIFTVFNDFGIGELVHGYGTIGCASPVALGALAVTEGMKPKKRVQQALEAAERHSAGVRGPHTILRLPPT